ncbi:hypothetical protein NDI76_08355 [Halogeometricum sp. S1BR25-6]|uniref:Secreted protein n=1 Tax=Halogeometricum salsisoli TaxID=2950536 RepID=A0ABU2GEQ6_9EURY|nr:hypothetical protein [Halogeometricum sp. S1BR25-6]MDS0298753.1 hypothetical protein [Halogeometricum sp. S1BR25-6]
MRRAALIRAAYGLLLLLAPDSLVDSVAGVETGRAFSVLRRILGIRHLLQAFLLRESECPLATGAGAGTDLIHAASLLPFVALDGSKRRVYVADFLVEVAFAAVDVRSALKD